MSATCETCQKMIACYEASVREHSLADDGSGSVTREWHIECYGKLSRSYPVKGLRWTLEARLLAAVVLRNRMKETVITKAEMESVKGMMLNKSEDGFNVEVTKA